MALTPTLLWAQTKDDLFLTVELSKPSDLKVDLTDESFKFFAKKDGKVYQFDFKFFKPVKSSEYKTKDQRFLEFKVPKTEPESWTALNSCGKKHYIKCNWDKWVDSDAEGDDLDQGFDMPNFGDFGDFDMNGMGGMDGMDGMDGMEDDFDELEETEEEKTSDCKNPNCNCNPCNCTSENQCSGDSQSLPKDKCCDSSQCSTKGTEESCCVSNKCSEKCPC